MREDGGEEKEMGDQKDFITPISGGGFTLLVWGIEIRKLLTSTSWNTPEMDFHLNLADEKFHLFLRRSPSRLGRGLVR